MAFVLSGGASLDAIQVGMLRALIERDIRPDVIVATSVGAVNGAFIASHAPTPSSLDGLADLWREARRGDVFPLEPLTGLLGFLGIRRNLVPVPRSGAWSLATSCTSASRTCRFPCMSSHVTF